MFEGLENAGEHSRGCQAGCLSGICRRVEKDGNLLKFRDCPVKGACRKLSLIPFFGYKKFSANRSALFSTHVTKALDLDNCSSKSPSVDAKKAKKRPKASALRVVRNLAEDLSIGSDYIAVDPVQVEVL